ncbi:hypothetical protein [Ruminococcus flavefaciens]|uniref:Uncharacterized protein n=1 Tax=Ruminococcus flavefaciens TaxID=1265 RepID=A0A1M7LEV9_RUMFL|nr:hypothetical protein [Ruminococcus flavefaciens]SHM76493.1 hypothetical protein SAMN04487860_11323 [Ruminococcus flavefaciens]
MDDFIKGSDNYDPQKNSFTGQGNAAEGYGQKKDTGYKPAPDFYAMYNERNASSDTEFMLLVKGALGAMIGAIPGFFMIAIIARFGLIASICGALLAAGVFFGYYLATHKSGFNLKAGGITCIIVMIIAVYLAVRTSWVYELKDTLLEMKSLTSAYLGKSSSYEDGYKSGMNDVSRLVLGYEKPTYSNCSDCFGDLLSTLGKKGLFMASLAENYIFSAIGGVWIFSKFGKKSY